MPPDDGDRCGELELRLRFPAEPLAVRAVLQSVVAGVAWLEPSDEALGRVELTLAEALNNVVEHAYRGRSGPIEVHLERGGAVLKIEILDEGTAMPSSIAPSARGPDPAALPEGGFGWCILQALAGDLDYERDGHRNRLRYRVGLDQACHA